MGFEKDHYRFVVRPIRATYRLRGNSPFNLKAHHMTTILFTLLLSLGLLTVAFRYAPVSKDSMEFDISEQEIINIEDVIITQQIEIPPPPPKPTVPIEIANDEVLKDDDLNLDAFLDVEAVVNIPPPPAPIEEKPNEPEIFLIVEQYPELISIDQLEYPLVARRGGIEERVTLRIVVDENGMPESIIVVGEPNKLLADEAVRIAKTARFKPGRQRGRAVKVRISLPITFRLK